MARTVAVNLTGCQAFDGFSDEVTFVVVPAGFTFCVKFGLVLLAKAVSSLVYIAVTLCDGDGIEAIL